MGLVNITPIEDGTVASANSINEPIGKLAAEINGNLDSSNLANNAVTTAKIADGSVTSAKLNIERSIDDRGWDVINYGGFKSYRKIVLVRNFTINPGDLDYTFFSIEPPVGVTATSTNTTVTQVLLWGGNSWSFIKKGDSTDIGTDGKINFSAHVQGTAGTIQIVFKYLVEVIV